MEVKFRRASRYHKSDFDDAVTLLSEFLEQDPVYGETAELYAKGGHRAKDAVQMFFDHPTNGEIILGFDEGSNTPIACCILNFGISTSTGGFVAKLDDVYVRPAYQGKGVGHKMMSFLTTYLGGGNFTRIDCSVHRSNEGAVRFYQSNGFRWLNEDKITKLL